MSGNAVTVWSLYFLVPFAFLSGSIPFGLLITRRKGIDVRQVGSRNIGATNVLRSAGKASGALTLLLDALKGALPVVLCALVIQHLNGTAQTPRITAGAAEVWLSAVGLAAVLGHMFSIFLSFRGGKGVATGFGVLLVYNWTAALVLLVIWIVVALATRYSSLAAITAVSSLPIVFFALRSSHVSIVFGALLAGLIVFRHRSNIKNLLEKRESRIGNR